MTKSTCSTSALAKKSTKADAKLEKIDINRDSRKQLNVSSFGVFYEKAKSRRTRQKAALEQSGNHNSAVALGKSKTRSAAKSTKSFEVEDLDKQLEQKSFLRRAKITHGLKKSMLPRPNRTRGLKRLRNLQGQNEEILEARRKKPPRSQLAPAKASARTLKSDSDQATRTPKSKGSEKKQKSKSQKDCGGEIKPDHSKNSAVKAEPSPVVIDLLSSDSDGDVYEKDAIQALTQLLQDEAIGRGATRSEMKAYAQCLFELGLHSREMILDALIMTSKTRKSNTHLASGIVNEWKWMKPFHKTIFCRWVLSRC